MTVLYTHSLDKNYLRTVNRESDRHLNGTVLSAVHFLSEGYFHRKGATSSSAKTNKQVSLTLLDITIDTEQKE